MDVLTRSITAAKEQNRFLNESEIKRAYELSQTANARLDAVKSLSTSSDLILRLAIDQIAGESVHTNIETNLCLDDGESILQYVTYSLLSGSASILEEHYLDRFIEKYLDLGVSVDQLRNAIGTIRDVVVDLLNHHVPQVNEKTNQGDHPTLVAEIIDYFELIIDEFTWESKFANTTDEQWDRMLEAGRRDIAINGTVPLEEVFPPGK
ncbi:Phycocyanin [Thalassoporum mexicanum PCC 7367]|uniref:Phycocyanin n=1 Tax=Thalassoporum mexicanum TaxID=3457544 RepID=UPI00029F82E5|nr:Phycocyanin [Pseudanabaena sp. PCC 7367]AFY69013.1 Phycocyanin [Pseudanabaena sp. PCC 7367]